jgi:uncharacterized membrane protein YqiK
MYIVMRILVFVVVGLIALFTMLRAYTDIQSEQDVIVKPGTVNEASVRQE